MPTENRSSNTEMVSVPREHELKIRQTPLADLLSGLKTGEIRDCSDREFAVGDTVLLREVDDARDYTGTVLRRTITHVQKHYGLPDHLCVLSYGQPAPQPHPEPIAWMVGTAFWWTKEEAERDAAATGLPIVGLGPMAGTEPAEQHQAEPVAWLDPAAGLSWLVDRMTVAPGIKLYTHADTGEVERLTEQLEVANQAIAYAARQAEEKQKVTNALMADAKQLRAERDALRAQLAERDALPQFAQTVIRKLKRFRDCAEDGQGADIGKTWFDVLVQLGLLNRVQRSPAWWEITDEGDALLDGRAALSASAKPSAPGVLPRAHDVNMFQRTAKPRAKS
ncbi:DUF3850 domain-containing protein [Pseudomonas sp. SMV7]|uniref:DUF3850 domain-containing protein n=1 Tax=Pseudomonas sp. SMV7 TaxID=3390194 RepID=UPI003F87DA5A